MKPLTTIQHSLVQGIVTDEKNEFVTLGDGRFSKVYLLALQNEKNNSTESYIALKVQRDDYPDLGNIFNSHIDRMWKDEYENLQKLTPYASIIHIRDTIRECSSPNVSKDSAGARGPLVFAPLCYCIHKKVFFYLPCPETGVHMENYKIGNHYEHSAERFICSASGKYGEKHDVITLYAKFPPSRNKIVTMATKYEPFLDKGSIQELRHKMNRSGYELAEDAVLKVEKPGRKWVVVEDKQQKYFIIKDKSHASLEVYRNTIALPENFQILYQEDLLGSLSKKKLARNVEESGANEIVEIEEVDENGEVLEQEISPAEVKEVPCLNCEQCADDNFSRCAQFKLFSFYEFYAIPLETCHFPFKSVHQVISQRKMQEIREELLREKWYFAHLFPLEERLFAFKKNEEKRLMEILSHKLTLFLDICTAVGSIHKKLKTAHMHLLPEHLMVIGFLDISNYKNEVTDRSVAAMEKGAFRPVLLDIAGLSSLNETKSDFPDIGNHNFLNSSLESESLKSKIADIDRGITASSKPGLLTIEGERFKIRCDSLDFQVENYYKGDWILWERKGGEAKSEWGQLEHIDAHTVGGKIWQQDTVLKLKKQTGKNQTDETGTLEIPVDRDPKRARHIPIGELSDMDGSKLLLEQSKVMEALPMPKPGGDSHRDLAVNFKHYPGYGPHYDLYGLGKLLMYILFANQKVTTEGIENSIKNFSKYHGLKEDAPVQEVKAKILAHVEKDSILRWGNLSYEPWAGEVRYVNIWQDTAFLVFALITTEFKNFSFSQKNIDGETLLEGVAAEVRKILENIAEVLYSQVEFYQKNNSYEMELAHLREQNKALEEMLKKAKNASFGDMVKKIFKRD